MTRNRIVVPASFFGIILGLVGLGNCWRVAARLWQLPPSIGEGIMLVAALVWIVLLVLYAGKWVWARPQALAEFYHPVQCCFIGLIPVSTMLVALAAEPYSSAAANVLFVVGAVGQLGFGVHRTGTLWMGGRDPAATTPVAYLPTVAGSFVTAIVAGALGYTEWGWLFFGAGLFSWIALESVVLRRLIEHDELAVPLRPTMGIHFAPPAVACAAYLSITTGVPDLFAHALLGYALFQGLVLVRLAGWLGQQSFASSYWAYTFATTAVALSALRFVERGMTGPFEWIAPLLFVVANLVIGGIAVGTVWLALRGKLFPFAPTPVFVDAVENAGSRKSA